MPVPSPVAAISPNPVPEVMAGKAKDVDPSPGKSSLVVERILSDILSAGAATLLVSPIICLIDRSIIENASGRSSSVLSSAAASLKTLLKTPHKFLLSKPFALIYMTYFGTYFTANSIDTASSLRNGTDLKTVTAGTEKMFGTGSPRPVALPTFILFSARDAMTIFSSFNVPPLLAPHMPQNMGVRPESFAQFLAPAGTLFPTLDTAEYVVIACQIFSTPLHLTGLDIYNRQGKATVKTRWEAIKKNWASSAAARMCRIIPAFGFGGVANAGIRRSLLEKVEKRSRL
ncbi:hypothetical protein L873DRAFT_1711242 [Choiromyces venosus 120613-1]|uniref:Sequence orphan n=1 Tax=Choiromyces venosus 120613-1 TaxID=1336337 RepID=A0A3N4J686_9PEZI|nr:hypothetical protein L873DRAFT_1711242 [Choiromyces venosus 120613-1]